MDKEVKNRILLGKNGTKYVVADKYVDGTYSVKAIPGSEMVKFISENELYKDIAYVTDRALKGYKLNSLSKLFGSELDTSSKYAIYSLDSNGLMRVINLDTFEILECSKWNFQFLSREKGAKKPYINIYLKSATGVLDCYAVTNLMIDKAGSLDSNYYLGDVDYNLGTNLATFKRVNYSVIKRSKSQISLGSDIVYSPYNLNGIEIIDVVDRLDDENDAISIINDYKTKAEGSIKSLTDTETIEDNKPAEDDTNSSIERESNEAELNSSDDTESETADKIAETVDKISEPGNKSEDTEDNSADTVNEMDRFYDSNGNCIDIEGLMAYLDSQQIEKQLEETNKIDNKSSLADILNKDTDLYQTYEIKTSKLDAYKDMLGILSIYDTITLDKELGHKCIVIDDIVSGSTVKYIESGTDDNGVVQVSAENIPLNIIYICHVSSNGHKKYYLMHENQDRDTVKIQCISDSMKDYEYFDTSEFKQRYRDSKSNIQYIKL